MPTKLLTKADPSFYQFLGPRKGTPFVPFQAQKACLDTIKIPWPGRGKKSGRPYPRIFGACMGRRFGKTTMGEVLMWHGLFAPEDDKGPPTVRLTADTEEHALKIWRRFIFHLESTELRAMVKDYSREYLRVELLNDATAQLFSANNPQALSGDGVTLWVIDEAQFLSQAAWINLFPSVSDRSGVIVMLGVAQGEGPFKEICFRGDDAEANPAFLHLEYPTSDNPHIDAWEIELARSTLTPNEFKQLYLAQWVGELGKVFRNVETCISDDTIYTHPKGYGYTQRPVQGKEYFGGLDLARLQDWTVYTIWDRSGRLIAWDRFNMTSWNVAYQRCAEFSALYGHPITVVDSTGIGDPVFEALGDLGMNVTEYKIASNDKKRALVDEFAIRVGAGEVRYPRIPMLLSELNRMEAKQTPGTSLIRYEAPAGSHDDFVLSASLAMQVVPHPARESVHTDLLSRLDVQDAMVQHSAYEYV